jgi:RNA polymerase sigma factor (sigma-70 family)
MDDWKLLQDFRAHNSEQAFATLVNRYVGLVYSSALRQVNQPHLAEEVTQSVFILLARKASSFRSNIILASWLFRTTRFAASRALRSETRRKIREQEAFQMQELSNPDETWRVIAPVLDEALDDLSESDRNAVLLRFMGDKNLRETGLTLGISEDAAKKRVARALEKLRAFFQRRGFIMSAVVLAGALSEQLVGAAPAGLASSVTSAAINVRGAGLQTGLPLMQIAAVVAGLGIVVSLVTVQPWRKGTSTVPAPPKTALSGERGSTRAAATQPTAASQLRLRVVSAETGQGIPAARVFAKFWHDMQLREFATDSEGVCHIPLPDREFIRLDLGAWADWHVQKYLVFRDKTVWPVPAEFTLKLERAVSAGGWVRDESGSPVANAEILFNFPGGGDHSEREPQFERLGYAEPLPVATTDGSGHWACAILPPNYGQFTIGVSHPAYLSQSFATDKDESLGVPMTELWAGKAILVLKDKKPLSLSGRVTDLQGQPIPGAKVRAGLWIDKPDAVTDVAGQFQLTRLNPGTNGITVVASGFAPERTSVNVTPEAAPVHVQLKPGNLLRVKVVDENQSAVPDATVALFRWRDRSAYSWRANTDGRGYVEWTDAPADAMKFDVFKSGYFRSDEQPVQANGEEHTIILRRGLTVSGQVIDERTSERIPKFKVIPGYQDPDSRQWFRLDLKNCDNGYYEFIFETWRPPFTVRIEAGGYDVAMSKVLQPNPRDQSYDFALKRLDENSAISGTVLLPDGRPATRAEVALASLDYHVRLGPKRLQRENKTLVTNVNERGEFVFPADPNALTVVAVASEGFAMARVSPGEPARMKLGPWGRIEGTVRVPNPESQRRSVRLSHPSAAGNVGGSLSLWDYNVEVDAMGNFVIEDAPPGELSCLLYNERGIPGHKVGVDIQPGTTVHVEIGGTGSTVTGRFKTAGTNSIDWPKPTVARLEAEVPRRTRFGPADDVATLRREAEFWMSREGLDRSRASQMYPLDIDATGAFRVYDVPAGTYRLVTVFLNKAAITNVTIPDQPTVDLGELVVR